LCGIKRSAVLVVVGALMAASGGAVRRRRGVSGNYGPAPIEALKLIIKAAKSRSSLIMSVNLLQSAVRNALTCWALGSEREFRPLAKSSVWHRN